MLLCYHNKPKAIAIYFSKQKKRKKKGISSAACLNKPKVVRNKCCVFLLFLTLQRLVQGTQLSLYSVPFYAETFG